MKALSLTQIEQKLKMVIYGAQGSGKSHFAKDLAKIKKDDGTPMRVLYVDIETASLGNEAIDNLLSFGVDPNDFRIISAQEMKDVENITTKIKNQEQWFEVDDNGEETKVVLKDSMNRDWMPDAIVIDSLSAISQDEQIFFTEISKVRSSIKGANAGLTKRERMVAEATAGMELKDFGLVKMNGTKIITNIIRKLNIHCVLIFREKDEKEVTRVGNKIESVNTGNKIPDTWQFALYEGNIVVRLGNEIDGSFNQYKGIVEKDRTGTFIAGTVVEDPTPLMWEAKLKGTSKNQNIYKDVKTADEILEEKVEKSAPKKFDADLSVIAIQETVAKFDTAQKKRLGDVLKAENIPTSAIKEKTLTEEQAVRVVEIVEKIMETK